MRGALQLKRPMFGEILVRGGDLLGEKTVLASLFEAAREKDEFEYVCALLRGRGLEGPGWDPLPESGALTNDILAMIDAPVTGAFQLRLLLLLYCHVTEMDDLYAIPANMLRVCRGDRYTMSPFLPQNDPQGRGAQSPSTKCERIAEMARDLDFEAVAQRFEFFLVREVRNAFFHSTYRLVDTEFRITSGDGVTVDGVTSPVVPLEWLLPRVESAINLSTELVDLVADQRRGYTTNKVVTGRILDDERREPIELLGGDGGLTGFRSPPGKTE